MNAGRLAIVLGSLLAAACGGPAPGPSVRFVPEVTFQGVDFWVFRAESMTSNGTASRVAYRRDTGDFEAAELQVRLPSTPTRPAARILAPRGQGSTRSKDLLASGGVRLESRNDVALTEEARYDGADGLVHGEMPVVLSGPDYRLDGPRFVLDPNRQVIVIPGGVHLVAGPRGDR